MQNILINNPWAVAAVAVILLLVIAYLIYCSSQSLFDEDIDLPFALELTTNGVPMVLYGQMKKCTPSFRSVLLGEGSCTNTNGTPAQIWFSTTLEVHDSFERFEDCVNRLREWTLISNDKWEAHKGTGVLTIKPPGRGVSYYVHNVYPTSFDLHLPSNQVSSILLVNMSATWTTPNESCTSEHESPN